MKRRNILGLLIYMSFIILARIPLATASSSVTVSLEKDLYFVGDSLVVTGTVSQVLTDIAVSIQVYKPGSSLDGPGDYFAQAIPNSDGSYEVKVLRFGTDSSAYPLGSGR